MRKSFLAFSALVIIMFVSSCCGCRSGKSLSHTLVSDSWKLVELEGTAVNSDDPEAYTITFTTEDGNRLFGKGDCNRYFGSYTESGVRELSFSAMGSTKMFCPNQQREDQFLDMVQSVNSYTIDGDMLMLQKDGQVVGIMQAIPLIK